MDEIDFTMIITLSKTKNITKTADIMNLTQSALSKRISNIESELKTKILIRRHSGVYFTPAGEKVLDYCNMICNNISEMRLYLKEKESDVYGSLSIGVSDNYNQYHLPDLISAFHKKYPNVNLKIRTNRGHLIFPFLVADEIDIGIVRGDYNWDGYKTLLSSEAMCVVCNKEFEDRDLNSYMYIDRTTDTVQYALMNRWRHENGIKPNANNITVDSITTCMDLVRRGMGWALIPEVALENYKGCIIPCTFADGEQFVRKTYLYCKKDVSELVHAKAFIEEALRKKTIYPHAQCFAIKN